MKTILALDIGTSSSRAALIDAETGQTVPNGFAAEKHAPHTTPDGGATLDPEVMVQETIDCIVRLLKQVPSHDILAVGVSTFWHSFVGVDDTGKAQTPISIWSDHRASAQVTELRSLLNGDDYLQRTGCHLHTSYLPARLRWLKETDAQIFGRCTRFLSPGEYLYAQLFGMEKVTCSVSIASGTGLLDQAKGEWDDSTLAQIPGMTQSRLSPIDDSPVSGLQSPYRETIAALKDIPWFPAFGDGACSNLGCGAVTPNRIAMMIGTSGALRVMTEPGTIPAVPPGLWRYQVDKDRYLIGGALSNGGNVWSWLRQTFLFSGGSDDSLEAEIGKLPADGHKLTVLPFLSGERAPLWREDTKSVIMGLTAGITTVEIARAYMEAVAYRFAAVRDRLRVIIPHAEIIGTGSGLVSSPVWAQIIADVLGEPIDVSTEKQASSLGAALKARAGIGMGGKSWETVSLSARYEPREANTDIYQAGRQRHEALMQQIYGV